MAGLPYVLDGTAETFPRLVLENSRRGPVAVNFWSPRAGPCLIIMPRLVRVAQGYGGRLLLVMINTDEYGELARRLDVRALPMLQLFRHGVAIDRLQGVESEAALRAFLDRYVVSTDPILAAYSAGETARAAQLAAAVALDTPTDPAVALRVAKLLVLDGRWPAALALLEALPLSYRAAGEIADLHAHLTLIAAADEAPPLDASRTRFVAAAQALREDDYEGACAQLLALAAANPAFGDGLALRAARAISGLPGLPAAVVARLQAQLVQV
ncbi:MAG: thioredoxin family protein [Acidiferrobacter sp.]